MARPRWVGARETKLGATERFTAYASPSGSVGYYGRDVLHGTGVATPATQRLPAKALNSMPPNWSDEVVDVWRSGRGKLRAQYAKRISENVKAEVHEITQAAIDGKVDWRVWRGALRQIGRESGLLETCLGTGTWDLTKLPAEAREWLYARMDKADQLLSVKLQDIRRRMRLKPGEEGYLSPARARAITDQVVRGHAWEMYQNGTAASFHGEPVVRIMGLNEHHCHTCHPKAGVYANIEVCRLQCGGLPGEGGDECHGYCHCRLIPHRVYQRGPHAGRLTEVDDTQLPAETA